MSRATSAREGICLPLRPVPVARPWGGRTVAPRFGWDDGGEPVGEWWLASTCAGSETPVGADGRGLAAWLDDHGRERGLPTGKDFPLLVKLLDAQDVLSVQVHPDDLVARLHGLPRGKTEAWHVLSAEPGASVFLGTAEGVSVTRMLDRIEAGADDAEVVTLLRRVPVLAGDTLLVQAGTVHAIGPGVVLYEVQNSSEATYRVHDWGRGRQLHLDQARDACVDWLPTGPVRTPVPTGCWSTVVSDRCFHMHRGRCADDLGFSAARDFAVLTVLAGSGRLESGDGSTMLQPGTTVLVTGRVRLHGELDVVVVEPG